ncbi:hypothetical protein AAVH_09119 [Aphelenchoides avenae]|nr:hypothetical protein AAVH_09119 [Aphelenchus avenae]
MSSKPPPSRDPTLTELNAEIHQSSPATIDFSLPAPSYDAARRPEATRRPEAQPPSTFEAAVYADHVASSIQNAPTFDEYMDSFRRQNLNIADNWWTYSTSLQGIFFPFHPEGLPRRLTSMHTGLNVFVRMPSSRYTNAARYEPGTILRCSADFAEVAVRNELTGATIRQLRHRQARHLVPFEISLEADTADAPIPTIVPVQPTLRQYSCACCDLNLADVTHLNVFEKSLILAGSDNRLHLVDLTEAGYWGILNVLFHRLPTTSVQRTIRFVSPQLKRTTLDQLTFYFARVPNVTTFVYPRTVADEFALEACRHQLEAHQHTLRTVINVPKWTHLPTCLIAKGKRFQAATDIDPITQCTWLHQRIAVYTSAPEEAVTFTIHSNRILGLMHEIRGTSARFLARRVIIRVQRHFASDDLEALTDALNEAETVFAFAEEFSLFLMHTPPAIASMNVVEGFAITVAQQLTALEFALRIWLSSAPLQRQWTTEVRGELRAFRAVTSSEYPTILQKLGRSLQMPFATRRLRRDPASPSSTEIRSTMRHLHQQRTCVISAALSPEPGQSITSAVPSTTTWQDRFAKALAFTEQEA